MSVGDDFGLRIEAFSVVEVQTLKQKKRPTAPAAGCRVIIGTYWDYHRFTIYGPIATSTVACICGLGVLNRS